MIRQIAATRALLLGAALCNAGFWILAAVIGTFFGAAATRHALWFPSQLLHVLGALLVIPAIPALMLFARQPGSKLSAWAGSLAMIGSALFAADGVIALSVFPTVAANARDLLEPYGAMNRGIMLGTYIAISAVNMTGWILVAVALWNGRAPNWIAGMLLAGALLSNLPPGLVPLMILAIGGLLWSAALVLFANDPSQTAPRDTAPLTRRRSSTIT